jgi:DNA polymerase III subunit chi
MTEIRFYHLNRKPLLETVAILAERAITGGKKVVIMAETAAVFEKLSDALWVTKPESFLPHTSSHDESTTAPIFITDTFENPTNAQTCFILPAAPWGDVGLFTLVCHIFEGQNESQVIAARAHWKTLKDQGHTLTYWQQDEAGKWIQKQ